MYIQSTLKLYSVQVMLTWTSMSAHIKYLLIDTQWTRVIFSTFLVHYVTDKMWLTSEQKFVYLKKSHFCSLQCVVFLYLFKGKHNIARQCILISLRATQVKETAIFLSGTYSSMNWGIIHLWIGYQSVWRNHCSNPDPSKLNADSEYSNEL